MDPWVLVNARWYKHYIQSRMIDAQRVLLEVVEQRKRGPR